jgi:hypothetical protein
LLSQFVQPVALKEHAVELNGLPKARLLTHWHPVVFCIEHAKKDVPQLFCFTEKQVAKQPKRCALASETTLKTSWNSEGSN